MTYCQQIFPLDFPARTSTPAAPAFGMIEAFDAGQAFLSVIRQVLDLREATDCLKHPWQGLLVPARKILQGSAAGRVINQSPCPVPAFNPFPNQARPQVCSPHISIQAI